MTLDWLPTFRRLLASGEFVIGSVHTALSQHDYAMSKTQRRILANYSFLPFIDAASLSTWFIRPTNL